LENNKEVLFLIVEDGEAAAEAEGELSEGDRQVRPARAAPAAQGGNEEEETEGETGRLQPDHAQPLRREKEDQGEQQADKRDHSEEEPGVRF